MAMADDKDCPPELSKAIKENLAKGVPPIGEKVTVEVPLYLMNQLKFFYNVINELKQDIPANMTAQDAEVWKEVLGEAHRTEMAEAIKDFYKLQCEIEQDVAGLKAIYRTSL